MPGDAIFRGQKPEVGERLGDAVLLRRYADDRAEEAFAELVRRHLDGVYSAALRRVGGDTHLAEDVAQQVFVALARKARGLARHPVLTGWLYLTTRNEAANVVRTERRRKAREQEAHAMHDSSPTDEADWSRVAPLLDTVIDELAEHDRIALLLRFIDRRGFAEIGGVLRLTEDAARMRVDRALDKLRALLAKRGVTSTSAALGVVLANHAVVAAPAGLAASLTGAALTSATATAAMSLATAFQLMVTSKITMAASAAILIVALGLATRESRARRAAEEALAGLASDGSRLTARLRDLQQRAAAEEEALQRDRADLARAEQAAARPVVPPKAVDPVTAGKEFLAQHPEAGDILEESVRANLANSLAVAHYRVVNLTPQQREQLEAILARASTFGPKTFDLPEGRVTLRRETLLSSTEMEAQARQVIGDEAYREFMTTGKRLSAGSGLTTALASAVYRTAPLSALQTEKMLEIFAAVGIASPGGAAQPDWEKITPPAAEVLTPAQLAALEGVRRRNEARRPMDPSQLRRVPTPTNP